MRTSWKDAGQLAARIDLPEQHVGKGVAAFLAGIPEHEDARDLLSRQASVMTALPAMMATTVFGFAAATAWISFSSSGFNASELRSPARVATARPMVVQVPAAICS